DGLNIPFLFLWLLWSLRIVFLKNKKLLIRYIVSLIVFASVLFYHQKNQQSQWDETIVNQTQIIMHVDPTTIEIAGDYLRFEARGYQQGRSEKVMVNYTLQSEE